MDGQNQENFYQENLDNIPTSPSVEDVAAPKKTDALAVVSLVMGILSIVMCCCYGIGAIFGIPGLICAILSKKKAKSGLATAGLVCSIIGLVLSVIAIVYYVIYFVAIFSDPELMGTIMESYY